MQRRARALLARLAITSRTTAVASGHGQVGEPVGLGAARLVLEHTPEHLRDDVAGALDRHRVADPHVQPLDLVLVVQRRVRHHHAADRHRLEPGDRRQRAGAPDLDVDRLERWSSACSAGNLCAIAQRGVRETKPSRCLQIEAVDLVDHAVDVVAERGALRLDLAVKGDAAPRPLLQIARQRIGREARTLEGRCSMPDWVSAGSRLISPQA